jgi:hypothetical protein
MYLYTLSTTISLCLYVVVYHISLEILDTVVLHTAYYGREDSAIIQQTPASLKQSTTTSCPTPDFRLYLPLWVESQERYKQALSLY